MFPIKIHNLEIKKEYFIATFYLFIAYFLGAILLNFLIEEWSPQPTNMLYVLLVLVALPPALFLWQLILMLYIFIRSFKFSTKDVLGLGITYLLFFIVYNVLIFLSLNFIFSDLYLYSDLFLMRIGATSIFSLFNFVKVLLINSISYTVVLFIILYVRERIS